MQPTSFFQHDQSLGTASGVAKSPSAMTTAPSSPSALVSRPSMQMPPRGTGVQIK